MLRCCSLLRSAFSSLGFRFSRSPIPYLIAFDRAGCVGKHEQLYFRRLMVLMQI